MKEKNLYHFFLNLSMETFINNKLLTNNLKSFNKQKALTIVRFVKKTTDIPLLDFFPFFRTILFNRKSFFNMIVPIKHTKN